MVSVIRQDTNLKYEAIGVDINVYLYLLDLNYVEVLCLWFQTTQRQMLVAINMSLIMYTILQNLK